MRNNLSKRLTTVALCAAVFCLCSPAAFASGPPQEDEQTRRLWDTEFLKKRPRPRRAPRARKKYSYRRAAPSTVKAAGKQGGELVGVTVWRLRPGMDSDDKRILVQEKDGDAGWMPERIEAETPLVVGERVRLSIESPRNGYLYVIDREKYADGTLGDPYLIFPTLKARAGDNAVKAGRVVEIPSQDDRVPYFTLKALKPDYAGEVLTVLVTPEPLTGVEAGPEMVKLSKEQVERWENQWMAQVERFEMVGGAGKPYTKAEKEAGQDRTRLLTQGDDLPQTFYLVATKPGSPLLFTMALRIKE